MALVLDDDDLSSPLADDLSKEDIQHRVDDWLGRLNALFRKTEQWAAEQGWAVSRADAVPMNEELMRQQGVSPAEQPVLRIDGPEGGYALFKPKGLWVIGANGRVDLYTSKGAFILVDKADEFRTPSWQLFRASGQPEGIPYAPELLTGLA